MLAVLPHLKDAPLPELPRFAPADSAELKPLQRLTGHSGAEVMLCLRGSRSVVRKTAGSMVQNARLSRQAEKQRLLFAHGLPFPRVHAEGMEPDGRAFVEMDYVPARTVASIIVSGTPFDHGPVLAAIERALALFRMTEGEWIRPETFHRKIAETAGVARVPIIDIVPVAGALMGCDWTGIPSSACHGDLTLENLLLGQDRVPVFIDCDEPFASSYWIDLAKLCQDVDGHWCLRQLYFTSPKSPALLNAVERLHRLAPHLRALAERVAPGFESRRHQLTALNLFRTLPYTGDERQIAFVLGRMRALLALPKG